jgi:hypothetical protein
MVLRRLVFEDKAIQETLIRKTRLLRKIGPMAMRSSVTSKIVLSRTILRRLATNDLEIASSKKRTASCDTLRDPGPGSISSSRCQKSRMPLHREVTHAKLYLLRGRLWWRWWRSVTARLRLRLRRAPRFAFVSCGCATRSRRRSVVEPDGIEPTTSCLQSRRSPS